MWDKEFGAVKGVLSLNIKHLRMAKGIAQEKLGLEAGVDRTVISKIEREVANPSLEVLVKIASFLDVKVSDLLKPAEH